MWTWILRGAIALGTMFGIKDMLGSTVEPSTVYVDLPTSIKVIAWVLVITVVAVVVYFVWKKWFSRR